MLNIIFEDKDILVIDKPAGIAVQTARLTQKDLESEIKSWLAKKGEGSYLGIVHRLDQPVSGVVVFAKNEKAARELSLQLQGDKAHKEYAALVVLKNDESKKADASEKITREVLTDYLIKDAKQNKAVIADAGNKQAKKAVLEYELYDKKELDSGYALGFLRIWLHTGRFHQIRAQLSNAGMTILGDTKYGFDDMKNTAAALYMKELKRGEIALCAKKLMVKHPVKKTDLSFESSYGNWGDK